MNAPVPRRQRVGTRFFAGGLGARVVLAVFSALKPSNAAAAPAAAAESGPAIRQAPAASLPAAVGTAPATAPDPAGPLVWIGDVAPAVVEEMRYAGSYNFTGARVAGYDAPRCWLSRPAAAALARADGLLAPYGLGLKVYDCYRPLRAVQAMVQWSRSTAPASPIETFFLAGLTRPQVIALRYLSPRSAHSRGSTVDVTLIARDGRARSLEAPPSAGTSCSGGAMLPGVEPSDQPALQANRHIGSVRMGTSHDCFDALSHTINPALPPSVRAHRALLVETMKRAGFRNYAKEWWHYTLNREPFLATGFDVPITGP